MYSLRVIALTAAMLAVPSLGAAAPASGFGAPFLVIDGPDTSGSILDFFDGTAPSGFKNTDLSGTITRTVGAPSLVGQQFSFSSSVVEDRFELTLGSTVSGTATGGFFGSIDPFMAGPGDLNFNFFVIPPFTDTMIGLSEFIFDYGGAFEEFPDRTAEFPEFELALSVFLSGPLPTLSFDDGFGAFDYVEGPLTIDRIEISTAGGAPIPPAVIPLPASALLLMLALVGLGTFGTRSRLTA